MTRGHIIVVNGWAGASNLHLSKSSHMYTRTDRWTDGRMDGEMDGCMDGWMNRWMDGWIKPST